MDFRGRLEIAFRQEYRRRANFPLKKLSHDSAKSGRNFAKPGGTAGSIPVPAEKLLGRVFLFIPAEKGELEKWKEKSPTKSI